jgi:hypothetical protein
MPRIQLTCLTCSKAFSGKSSENRKFCNSSCAAIFNNKISPKRKKIPTRICVDCKNTYSVLERRYSKKCISCVSLSLSKKTFFLKKPRKKKIKKCKLCNKEYEIWRYYCDLCKECFDLKLKVSIKDITIGEAEEKYGKIKSRIKARRLCSNKEIRKLKTECQFCKNKNCLEIAHIIQISDADKDMKISELNDPSNLLVLCATHHSMFDEQKILLESIPMRDGQQFRTNRNHLEKKNVENNLKLNNSVETFDETKPRCGKCNKNFIPSKSQSKKLEKKKDIFCSLSCAAYSPRKKQTLDYSKCKNRTIEYYTSLPSLKNLHNSSKFAHIRLFNRTWNKHLLTQPCKFCGSTDSIELAHIKAISSFPKETKLEVVNNPNNVIPLCSNCHKKFDSKQIITSF